MHVLRDYVALIEILVAHIEHLRERKELGILMLASNLAHFVKIPFVPDVASDVESECSRIAVVEVVINLLEVSLRILVVDCGVYSSSLDNLFIDEVVAEVVAALCTDCAVTAIHYRDKRYGWDCPQFVVTITDFDMQVADVLYCVLISCACAFDRRVFIPSLPNVQ